MELVAEWSVRCEPVNIADAANISGYSQAYIRDTYRAGVFAPAPDVRLQVVNLPLHHVFALAVIAEAEKQGISLKQLADVLPVLAGSAYIRFIETEVQAGRCLQHAGIQSLNAKLWHALRSGAARKGLEQRLPGGPVAT